MKKYSLFVLSSLFFFLEGHAQNAPQTIQVDENLSAAFPGNVQRQDTIGFMIVQMTRDNITYQIIKQHELLDKGSRQDADVAIHAAANAYMKGARFADFHKVQKDTVLGKVLGCFVHMSGIDNGRPMHVYIFLASQGKTLYSIQVSSFNKEEIERERIQSFFNQLRFKGVHYL